MSDQSKFPLVMLIDDNEMDNFINRKLIENENFAEKTILYQSALLALTYLKEITLNSESIPNVIFLDISMPGMDGFGFLSEFDKLNDYIRGKCKIVMLSTSENFSDLNRANQNKYVSKFLNKPLTAESLNALNL